MMKERARAFILRRLFPSWRPFPEVHMTHFLCSDTFDFTQRPYAATLTDVLLLRALAIQRAPCRLLEIGTWNGNTVRCLKDCASITTIDLMPSPFDSEENITHIQQDSRKISPQELGEFDLVFVDGDHSYSGVLNDTRLAFAVLAKGGAILWHDYLKHGTITQAVLAAIQDGTPEPYKDRIYHVIGTKCALFYPGIPRTALTTFKITVARDRQGLAPAGGKPV